MLKYLELLNDIRTNGDWKEPSRPGMPRTIEVNSRVIKHNLADGFPLLTTKHMFFKGIKAELFWFLSGSTNITYLWKYNCHIWDKDAYKYYTHLFGKSAVDFEEWKRRVESKVVSDEYTYGDCGRIYGHQWRNFEFTFDQIKYLIENIKTKPDSRYHLVTAWNPVDHLGELNGSALPACHCFFQCFVRKGFLDLTIYQRSCDTVLGVPFNIASYALLLCLLAKECGYEPGILTWIGGSVHIYENHLEAVEEQLTREPYPLPSIKIADKPFFELTPDDVELENYIHHEKIEAPLSVGV